jgi:enoyl-CoA hydratase
MTPSHISLDLEHGIYLLTLRRPDKLNALSTALCLDVAEAIRRVDGDVGARALILTGEGKAFSAGADLVERDGAAPEAIWAHNRAIYQIPLALEQLAVPTIAAVNGIALGGGCEIALGCDLRYASETAEFASPEVTLGIIPGAGGTQRLARVAGLSRAIALILTGRRIGAAEAYRIGLADAVLPPADLLPAVLGVAAAIAANAPLAVRAAKRAIRYGLDHSLEAGLTLEGNLQRMLYETEDCREGITAFRQRRPPRWLGR